MADGHVDGSDIGCAAFILAAAILMAGVILAHAVKDAAGKLAPNPPEVKKIDADHR